MIVNGVCSWALRWCGKDAELSSSLSGLTDLEAGTLKQFVDYGSFLLRNNESALSQSPVTEEKKCRGTLV